MNELSNALDDIGDICAKMLASYEIFAKNHGISDNELSILYELWVHQTRTQKQIADKHLLAKQTIHTLCKKYEQDGMILVQSSDNDKREKILSLTDKGKDFARPIIETLLNKENTLIDKFGSQKMAMLITNLNELQTLMANHLEQ